MAILFWIYGSFALFVIYISFTALAPAVYQVYEIANNSAADIGTNATEIAQTQNIMAFAYNAFTYVAIILVITVILLIYLASTSKQPESDIRYGKY